MKKCLLLIIGLSLSPTALFSQGKPVIVIHAFKAASDVVWPYDMKQLQAQAVAEFKVELGKNFEVVAEAPTAAQGNVYTLETEITAWHPCNAAKRLIVRLGSGRESAD